MECVECGKGRMVRKKAKVPHEIRGIKFEVEDTVNVCQRCGFITIPLDHADEHGRLVDETYRRLEGILSADEIVAARRRLGMSQREFASYLGVGEASVKRWEKGVLPDKSSSDLIRLKTDPAEALKNYRALRERLELRKAGRPPGKPPLTQKGLPLQAGRDSSPKAPPRASGRTGEAGPKSSPKRRSSRRTAPAAS